MQGKTQLTCRHGCCARKQLWAVKNPRAMDDLELLDGHD